MNRAVPRAGYGVVALLALFALVSQLALTISGAEVPAPPLDLSVGSRLVRLVSYFTIQSNLLVCLTSLALVVDGHRDGPVWRVARLNAIAGITLTGVVHWFLLRGLVSLSGLPYVIDKLFHIVVPVLAVATWCVFGLRARLSWRVIWASLIWPVGWLITILALGAGTGWYPYPFLDVDVQGPRPVAVVAVFLIGLSALLLLLDRVLPSGRMEAVSTAPDRTSTSAHR